MDEDFKLEKMQINERLHKVEETLHSLEIRIVHLSTDHETQKNMLTALVKEIKRKIDKHGDNIFGNGNQGMKTQIAQLEQSERTRTWNLRAVWAGMISLFVSVIASYFNK